MLQVFIPAGEFKMSSAFESDYRLPVHTVFLDAFWIDRTEVTNAMFAKFVAEENYRTEAEQQGYGYVLDPVNKEWVATYGVFWSSPSGATSDINSLQDHPVVQVSWNDASAYCQWAGRRLPTEAEWEKAARGTDGRIYPWGNESLAGNLLNFGDTNLDVDAWRDATVDDGYWHTAPVGSYPAGASPYGAFDMAGNVSEWVSDWYGSNNTSETQTNPIGPEIGEYRVLRGGSWVSDNETRSTHRGYFEPVMMMDDFGFRCASTP